MIRRKDWRSRLGEKIEELRRQPFVPGSRDCALFAADCVEAMTGVDLAASFRGQYATIPGAVRALREAGYDTLIDVVSEKLTEVPVARAVFGDIAAIATDDGIGWNLGVVNGETVIVMRPDGLGVVSRTLLTRAFRV